MKLSRIFPPFLFFSFADHPDMSGKWNILDFLLKQVAETQQFSEYEYSFALDLLKSREGLSPTAHQSCALPHIHVPFLKAAIGAVYIPDNPIDFSALDKQPVEIIALLLLPDSSLRRRMTTLSAVAKILNQTNLSAELVSRSLPEAREYFLSLENS